MELHPKQLETLQTVLNEWHKLVEIVYKEPSSKHPLGYKVLELQYCVRRMITEQLDSENKS